MISLVVPNIKISCKKKLYCRSHFTAFIPFKHITSSKRYKSMKVMAIFWVSPIVSYTLTKQRSHAAAYIHFTAVQL